MADKPTKRDHIVGTGEAVAGTALATGTPAGFRAERMVRESAGRHYDRKADALKIKRTERAQRPSPIRTPSGYRAAEGSKAKSARAQDLKTLTGKIERLHAKRNAVLKPKVFNNQTKAWAVGVGVGVPMAWHGVRRQFEKNFKRRDADATMAGTVAGAGGYQAASLAMKPLDRRAERKIADDIKLSRIQREHQRKYLTGGKIIAGNPENRAYFRNYPKSLPGSTFKRVTAVSHTGKSGTALTAAAGAAGAYGGFKLGRKRQEMKKSLTASAFGVEH